MRLGRWHVKREGTESRRASERVAPGGRGSWLTCSRWVFGGVNGDRFDGSNDTPQLTTDAIGPGNRDFSLSFPYLEPALTIE